MKTRTTRVVVFGGVAVVLYDAIAAVASRQFDFPYTNAAFGSYILYAVAGYIAGRAGGWRVGAAVGAVLGLIDASIGWAVSTALHANAPPTPHLTILTWAVVAVMVMVTGGICGLIGGAIGGRFSVIRAPAA